MISLSSPVTLTLTMGAILEISAASLLGPWFTSAFFASPGHLFLMNPLDYVRCISYIFGHASWEHCMGNMMIILILGPLLEEKYGSAGLALLIGTTAVCTSLICCLLGLSLIGASGIVFMFILMSSFGGSSGYKIPFTMVLVVLLYLGNEVLAGFGPNPLHISHFAHLIGGVFGLLFGALYNVLPPDPSETVPFRKVKTPDMSEVKF